MKISSSRIKIKGCGVVVLWCCGVVITSDLLLALLLPCTPPRQSLSLFVVQFLLQHNYFFTAIP